MSKVVNLTISGVKGIETRKDFTMSYATAFLGGNGTCKSSVIEAFRSAMFGTVSENMKNTSAMDAVALVNFENGDTVKTVVNEKGAKHSINGKAFTKKAVTEYRESIAEVPVEVAEILSQAGQYALDLTPDKFSLLFGGAVKSTIDVDPLLSRLALSQEEKAYFKTVYSDTDIGFDGLEKTFKILSEKMKELKHAISDAQSRADALSAGSPGVPLQMLNSRKEAILKNMNSAKSAIEAQKTYDRKMGEYMAACEKIEKLKVELQNKPAPVQEREIEMLESRKDRALKELSECDNLISVLELNVKQHKKSLDVLDPNKKICPLSGKIICTVDKTPARADVESAIRVNEEQLTIQRRKRDEIHGILESTVERLAQLRTQEAAAKAYAEKETELRVLLANMPERPVAVVATTGTDFDVLKAELEKVTAEIQAETNAETGRKLLETVKDKQEELALVLRLRTLTAPKGEAYNFILGILTSSLNTKLNEAAIDLGVDIEYEFRIDDGMTMYGRKKNVPNSEMIPVKFMSTGERFMTNLLLITLMNEITGNKFVVMDNIDCLDEGNLRRVMNLVVSPKYSAKFANVLISGVDHADTVKVVDEYAVNHGITVHRL